MDCYLSLLQMLVSRATTAQTTLFLWSSVESRKWQLTSSRVESAPELAEVTGVKSVTFIQLNSVFNGSRIL